MASPIHRLRAGWRGPRARVAFLIVAGALLAGGVAVRTLSSRNVAGDFLRYHRAGRIVVRGEADHLYDRRPLFDAYPDPRFRERNFRYLPAFAVLMAPLGLLPPRAAGTLWALGNAAAFVLILWVSFRLCRRLGARRTLFWVPVLFALRYGWDNLSLGQVNPLVILCALAGIHLVEKGRDAAGGLLTGLGAAVKFTPLILVAVYAVRGRGRAAVFSILGLLLFAVVLPGAVLGPGRLIRLTETVWHRQGEALVVRAEQEDVPGESLKAMWYRIAGPLPLRFRGRTLDVSLGLVSERQALWGYRVTALLLLAWLFRLARRRRDGAAAPLVWGAALGTLLLVSPETRQPHFLYLTPGVAALAASLGREGLSRARKRLLGGTLLVVLACTVLPSKSLVGPRAHDLAAALCLGGFAALLTLAALGREASRAGGEA